MAPTNAADRLEGVTLARALLASAARTELATAGDVAGPGLVLASCLRAAQLVGIARLGAVAGEFPASIQALMPVPEETIETERDASTEAADVLGFIDLVDIFSAEGMPCVAPRLHRGWQDKRQSCRSARALAGRIAGASLDEAARSRLLRAIAVYNRLFLVPPPVRVDVAELTAALAAVLGFMTDVLSGGDEEIDALVAGLSARLEGKEG